LCILSLLRWAAALHSAVLSLGDTRIKDVTLIEFTCVPFEGIALSTCQAEATGF